MKVTIFAVIDKPKTDFLKKSISYTGEKCWNDLPNEIKTKKMTIE